MMRNISIIYFCFLLLTACTSESKESDLNLNQNSHSEIRTKSATEGEYYYNTKGQVQHLRKSDDASFVVLSTDLLDTETMNSMRSGNSSLMEDCIFPYSEDSVHLNDSESKFICGKISNNDLYKFEKAIVYNTPCYFTDNGIEIAITHQFMIKLKDSSDYDLLLEFAKQNGASIITKNNIPLWYTLSCSDNSSDNALRLANKAYESGLFAFSNACFIEEEAFSPNYIAYNDPLYPSQWYLNNSSGYDINFSDTHKITRGNPSTKVAVVDQGFQIGHPDLIVRDSWDATKRESPAKSYGTLGRHGTSVAGIIGATANNAKGIIGIAPMANLLPISVDVNVNVNIVGSRDFITALGDAIDYACGNGAGVISNSWSIGTQDYTLYIKDAIDNAIAHGRNGRGCVVVFAAGNTGSNVFDQPMADNDAILCVGNINSNGIKADDSTFGEMLDVVAPGTDIVSLDSPSTYNQFSGTSLSCPMVAAVASLILSENPLLTQQQVVEIIAKTATKLPEYEFNSHPNKPYGKWNPYVGYGLLNSFDAVSLASGYYNLIEFDYTGSDIELSLTASKNLTIIWDRANNEQETVSGTNSATTVTHTFATSGTHRVSIAEAVNPLNGIPSYSSALLTFDLLSGEHASDIRINSINQQLRQIKIIGGNGFRAQTIRINNLPSLQHLYLIQCKGADVEIQRCPVLSQFATSRGIWMHPEVSANHENESPESRVVIGDLPLPPSWPDIPEPIPSLKSIKIARCPSLRLISLENTEINTFDFSGLYGLRYLYLSSKSNKIVGGSDNLLNITTQGEYLANSLGTLPERGSNAKGYVILRCIDATSTAYIPITIHNTFANTIDSYLTTNHWDPIWESGLVIL